MERFEYSPFLTTTDQ